MSNHFSSESRDPSYISSAMCPECSKKDWRGKSCWLNPQGKRPRGRPRTTWSDYISDLAWSPLGVEPAELPVDQGCKVVRSWRFLDGVGFLTKLGVRVRFFCPDSGFSIGSFFTSHSWIGNSSWNGTISFETFVETENSCCVPWFPLILTAKFHSFYVKESEILERSEILESGSFHANSTNIEESSWALSQFCSKLHQMCLHGNNEKSPSFRPKFQADYILWLFEL